MLELLGYLGREGPALGRLEAGIGFECARSERCQSNRSPLWSSSSSPQVDDGLSVEALPDGAAERVWVHIADVSRWVPEGSPLYEEARRRRTTIYLPEGAEPMFPAEVAHGVLSLR